MSDRERWIVYPLLFFSLFMGARQYYHESDEAHLRSISCNELTVNSFDGRRRVHIGQSTSHAGLVLVYGASDKPVLILGADGDGTQGAIEAMDETGRPVAALAATPAGGLLQISGSRDQPRLVLGHEDQAQLSGLLAFDANDKLVGTRLGNRFAPWGVSLRWKPSQASPDTPPAEGHDTPAPEPTGQQENESATRLTTPPAGGAVPVTEIVERASDNSSPPRVLAGNAGAPRGAGRPASPP